MLQWGAKASLLRFRVGHGMCANQLVRSRSQPCVMVTSSALELSQLSLLA